MEKQKFEGIRGKQNPRNGDVRIREELEDFASALQWRVWTVRIIGRGI